MTAKDSLKFTKSKRFWISFAAAALLIFAAVAVFSFTQRLTVSQVAFGCLNTFQDKSVHRISSVEADISIKQFTEARDEMKISDLNCIFEHLGFDAPDSSVRFGSDGKIDNESFQVSWRTIPRCVEGKRDEIGAERNLFYIPSRCHSEAANFNGRALIVNIKDFR